MGSMMVPRPTQPSHSVRDYLRARFSDDSFTDQADVSRWQPVLDRLAVNHPGDPIPEILRSPLRLFLVVTVYRQPWADPGELLGFKHKKDLDEHLFAHFIPVVASEPTRSGRPRSPESVRRWLTTLARYLQAERRAGRSGTDLALDSLWRAAGELAPRLIVAALFTTLAAVPLYFVWLRHLVLVGLPRDAYIGFGVVVSLALIIVIAVGSLRRTTALRRLAILGR
jgi:hypothetical protein